MEETWRGKAQIGVIHFMMFPDAASSVARLVDTARQILLDDFFGVLVVSKYPEDAKQAIKKMAGEAHALLGISSAPFTFGNRLNLASLDEEARRATVEALKWAVDDAYELGVKVVEVLDGAKTYPGPELEQRAVDQLVRSLIDLARYAEEKADGRTPVWVSLEAFDRSVEKFSVVGPAAVAVEVARKVRAEQPNFGITIDMGHVPLLDEGYFETLDAVKEYLVHVHLGNCLKDDRSHPSYGDQHPPMGMEGTVADVAELTQFLAAAKRVGYFEKALPTGIPWLTFEVKTQPGQSTDLVIANTKRAFKAAWARL